MIIRALSDNKGSKTLQTALNAPDNLCVVGNRLEVKK
jgi:hypothetical protein